MMVRERQAAGDVENTGATPPSGRPVIRIPPPSANRLPSKKWRDLILKVWHADPMLCPICRRPMRMIAVIDQPKVIEKMLRHLGLWSGLLPPTGPGPPAPPNPLRYEPFDDVDPTPDYENVLCD
jgi:hypothetical protein